MAALIVIFALAAYYYLLSKKPKGLEDAQRKMIEEREARIEANLYRMHQEDIRRRNKHRQDFIEKFIKYGTQ